MSTIKPVLAQAIAKCTFFFFFFFFLGRCEALQRTLGEWRKEKKGKGIDSQPSTRYHFEDDDFF